MDRPAFLTVDEFAEQLRVSPDHIHRMIDSGMLRAVRFGPRTTRIPVDELDRLAGFREPATDTASLSEIAS